MSPVEREGPEQTNELTTSDGRKVKVKLPEGIAGRIKPLGAEKREDRADDPPAPSGGAPTFDAD